MSLWIRVQCSLMPRRNHFIIITDYNQGLELIVGQDTTSHHKNLSTEWAEKTAVELTFGQLFCSAQSCVPRDKGREHFCTCLSLRLLWWQVVGLVKADVHPAACQASVLLSPTTGGRMRGAQKHSLPSSWSPSLSYQLRSNEGRRKRHGRGSQVTARRCSPKSYKWVLTTGGLSGNKRGAHSWNAKVVFGKSCHPGLDH